MNILKAAIASLDKAIEFHQKNQNDPYNISIAVICALSEVRAAFLAALEAAESEGTSHA